MPNPPEIALSDRLLRWLAWFAGIGAVYGALLPFDFRSVPFDQAVERFMHLDWTNIGTGGRYGYVAHFATLGFLTCGALSRRGQVTGVIITLALGAVLAPSLEFLQIWVAPRTVAASDVMAESLGWLIGVGTWLYAGESICALLERAARGNHEALKAGLLIYLGLYLFVELYPFDFFSSRSALAQRLNSQDALLWVSAHYSGGLRIVADMLNKIISAMPIGFLAYAYSRQWKTAIGFGLVLSASVEVLQFLEASGDADILSLVLRLAGCALGFAGISALDSSGPTLPRWPMRAAWIGICLYVLALNFILNLPLGAPVEDHSAILNQTHWLPLYNYYFVDLEKATASAINYVKVYIAFGAMVWLICGGREKGARWAVLAAILAQGGLEAAGFWFYWRAPDPTNVLLAALGSALGFMGAVWLRRSLVDVPAPHGEAARWLRQSTPAEVIEDGAFSPSALSILLASITIFICYASFYPFDFTSAAYTPERFRHLTVVGSEHSGRGDIVGNILLFLPFGFLGVVALNEAMQSLTVRVVKMLAAAFALAVATQTLQLFLPTRDASAQDIVSNMVGAALGGGLGLLSGDMLRRIRIGRLTSPAWIFSLLWAATLLLPLMPSLDYGALRGNLTGLLPGNPFSFRQAVPYVAGWLVLAEFWRADVRRYIVIAVVVMAAAALSLFRLNWVFVLAPLAALVLENLAKPIPATARSVLLMLMSGAGMIAIHTGPNFMGQLSKLPWMNAAAGTVFFLTSLVYFATKRTLVDLAVPQTKAERRRSKPRGPDDPAAASPRITSPGWASVPIGLRPDQVRYLNRLASDSGRSLSGATRYIVADFIQRLHEEGQNARAQQRGVAVLAAPLRHERSEEQQHLINLPDEDALFLGALSAELGTTLSRIVQMIIDEHIREQVPSGNPAVNG